MEGEGQGKSAGEGESARRSLSESQEETQASPTKTRMGFLGGLSAYETFAGQAGLGVKLPGNEGRRGLRACYSLGSGSSAPRAPFPANHPVASPIFGTWQNKNSATHGAQDFRNTELRSTEYATGGDFLRFSGVSDRGCSYFYYYTDTQY